jgi:hypothetical protein
MEELERRLEHPSSEARPLRGDPSPLGAGPGEAPGHSPSPYSPECVEGIFSELRVRGEFRRKDATPTPRYFGRRVQSA